MTRGSDRRLPEVFKFASGGMEESADAGPGWGGLKDAEPDLVVAAEAFEGEVRSEFVFGEDAFGLPEDGGLAVEGGGHLDDVDFEAGGDDFAIPGTAQYFRAADEECDFPGCVFVVVVKVAADRSRIFTVHDTAYCVVDEPTQPCRRI